MTVINGKLQTHCRSSNLSAEQSKAHFSDLLSCVEPLSINLSLEPFLSSFHPLNRGLCSAFMHWAFFLIIGHLLCVSVDVLSFFLKKKNEDASPEQTKSSACLLFAPSFCRLRASKKTHKSFIINHDYSIILFHFFNINAFVMSEQVLHFSFK